VDRVLLHVDTTRASEHLLNRRVAYVVHVLQRGVDVADIVNVAAICALDAQDLAQHSLDC
jgi:hypothetical protein